MLRTVLLTVVSATALCACAVGRAYEAEIISGNENHVSVKAGKAANPGPVALQHCAEYGREAVLETVQALPDFSVAQQSVYIFSCQ